MKSDQNTCVIQLAIQKIYFVIAFLIFYNSISVTAQVDTLWESDGANAVMQKSDNANLFIGQDAGKDNTGLGNVYLLNKNLSTSGNYNFGANYLNFYSLTSGNYNFGANYLNFYSLTSGNYNFGANRQNFYSLTSGSFNFGANYLNFYSLTSGNYNFGANSQNFFSLTSGSFNFGANYLNFYSLTSGGFNFGANYRNFYSLTSGNYNFGANYLNFFSLTNGSNNFGANSQNFFSLTSGDYNFGANYLNFYSLTNGSNNFGTGLENAKNVNSGSYNTLIGYRNIYQSTHSLNHTLAIGRENGYNDVDHSNSIYLGYRQGYTIGAANRLMIGMKQDNPLIYGEFDNDLLRVNGDLKATKTIEVESNLISYGINQYAPFYGFYMNVASSVNGGWARNLSGAYHGNTKMGSIYAYGTGSTFHRIGIDATGLNHTSKQFIVHSNGNVGINTSTPAEQFTVEGISLFDGAIKVTDKDGIPSNLSAWDGDKLVSSSLIENTGDFGMGTEPIDGYQLAVLGKIKTTEVQVQPSPWPDYVFDPSYQLTPLSEVEKHIKKEGHLEGIPSQSEVEQNGIALGEMNAKLLEKIEELTLYLIEQDKEIKRMKAQIKKLENH